MSTTTTTNPTITALLERHTEIGLARMAKAADCRNAPAHLCAGLAKELLELTRQHGASYDALPAEALAIFGTAAEGARLERAGYTWAASAWQSPYTPRKIGAAEAIEELAIFEGLAQDTAEPAFWQ